MKLRQVALVAEQLAPVREQLFGLLGLTSDFADPGVGEFGLHNSVMAIGNTFLEVVAPTGPGTAAGRLLERRGGNGGYMVLLQVDEIEFYRSQTESMGIRKIWEIERAEVKAFHVHPRDIGAAIVSFDQMIPPESWAWAGAGWQDRRATNVAAITAVDIQGEDPAALAATWSSVLNRDCYFSGGKSVIPLDEGLVNVVPVADGRGEGLCAVEFEVSNKSAIQKQAAALGLEINGNEVELCGTRFRFRNW